MKACDVCSSGLSEDKRKQECHRAYLAGLFVPHLFLGLASARQAAMGSPCSNRKWRKAPQTPSRYTFITRSVSSTFRSSGEPGSSLGV